MSLERIGADTYLSIDGKRVAIEKRKANCARCGNANCGAKPFTQLRLPAAFLAKARNGESDDTGYFAIDRLCPGGWVPVYCPRCEHRELTSNAPLTVPRGTRVTPELDLAYEADERAALADA